MCDYFKPGTPSRYRAKPKTPKTTQPGTPQGSVIPNAGPSPSSAAAPPGSPNGASSSSLSSSLSSLSSANSDSEAAAPTPTAHPPSPSSSPPASSSSTSKASSPRPPKRTTMRRPRSVDTFHGTTWADGDVENGNLHCACGCGGPAGLCNVRFEGAWQMSVSVPFNYDPAVPPSAERNPGLASGVGVGVGFASGFRQASGSDGQKRA